MMGLALADSINPIYGRVHLITLTYLPNWALSFISHKFTLGPTIGSLDNIGVIAQRLTDDIGKK